MSPVIDPAKSKEAPELIVTVGDAEAMFHGNDHLAIQGAVDYVTRLGGGVVRLVPGRYKLRNSIFLSSGITLEGSGDDTVLTQTIDHAGSPLTLDLDWYAWNAHVGDEAKLWRVGDGALIESTEIDSGTALQFTRHTIVSINDGRLGLNRQPRINHWVSKQARVTPAFSLIEARGARNLCIQNLALAGAGTDTSAPYLDGNYGGGIFLCDCEDVRISNVSVRDYPGDAISWQVSHDVVVKDCVIERVMDLGLHTGSGSQRPIMRRNQISECLDGIYWCWGVRNGLAEGNRIANCRRDGITIGHRDTDNCIRSNHIANCARAGVYFREERSPAHTAHRVLVENNEISPADGPDARGVVISRGVEDAVVRGNRIVVCEGSEQRAIVVDPDAKRPVVEVNVIQAAPGEHS